MDTYISALLLKYDHPRPRKPQHAPHKHREIIYGAKEQLLPDNSTSPPLDAAGIKRIQGIEGSLLYYARAVDNKLLMALSTISSQQTAATQDTAAAVHQLLDYVATYPNDGITYRASSMVLAAHSDASYQTEPGSRSRAGAHIFLSENDPVPRHNMRSSRSPRSLTRKLIPICNALVEMGWTQPKTPIQTDNFTTTGFVNDTIIQRRIKMIWMRLHWLRCRKPKGNSTSIGIADLPTWQITVQSTTHLHITWCTAPRMHGRSPM
eukprot:CCRYP_012388-RA/>CCRYP_012388-RA protein AED:0.44 eAED:0.46 QI:0/0/0/1/0/0/2/0/263